MKTALVTGAASGIGALAARRLAAAGWAVVACDVDEVGLGRTAFRSADMHTRVCDVSDGDAVARVVSEAGRLDRVIHAAGISAPGTALDQPLAEAERIWRVDFLGTVQVVRAVLPGMLDQGHGELVLFSSLAGWIPSPKLSAYAAAMAGINAYAKVLEREYGGRGVKIRCVCPRQEYAPQVHRIAAEADAPPRTSPTTPFASVARQKGMSAGTVLDAVDRSFARDELFVFPGATSFSRATALFGATILPGAFSRATALLGRPGGTTFPGTRLFPEVTAFRGATALPGGTARLVVAARRRASRLLGGLLGRMTS